MNSSMLSHNIKCLLIKHDLRQADIVEKTGMAEGSLWEIIHGHKRDPSIWTCVSIADAIGCSIDDLVKGAR